MDSLLRFTSLLISHSINIQIVTINCKSPLQCTHLHISLSPLTAFSHSLRFCLPTSITSPKVLQPRKTYTSCTLSSSYSGFPTSPPPSLLPYCLPHLVFPRLAMAHTPRTENREPRTEVGTGTGTGAGAGFGVGAGESLSAGERRPGGIDQCGGCRYDVSYVPLPFPFLVGLWAPGSGLWAPARRSAPELSPFCWLCCMVCKIGR